MASRLYPTTRRLFRQVVRSLREFGLRATLSPLVFGLMALYITGLLLLDRRQNVTRISDWLPARAHDALNRLLRTHQVSTRAVMGAIISWAKGLGNGHHLSRSGSSSCSACACTQKKPWVRSGIDCNANRSLMACLPPLR